MATVLIGCEESGVVRRAFRALGHDAFSCDLLPARDGNKSKHFQKDVKEVLRFGYWDLVILHPSCTALALSGNGTYGTGKAKHQERKYATAWTLDLWELAKRSAKRVALENPVGVLFGAMDVVPQYVQPWQFGHGETKKTGFALHNLPPLIPTDIVAGREQRVWKMPPSKTRSRDISETYQGIADAMAKQWGALCTL